MSTYAIVKDGPHQLQVEKGKEYRIALRDVEPGDTITLDEVVMLRHEGDVELGQPLVEQARVEATALREEKGNKVIVYKFRRRKGSQTKNGHRQRYTRIRVNSILKGDKEI